MRRIVAALIALGFVATMGRAAATTEPAAAVTQERLGNGLRVIYLPRHDWPTVSVRVVYHVGSKDESPGRQGFAHLFEHMMFRGSAHVAPEEHARLITEVGGACNAETSFDQTQYFETVPAEQLELALWLEADRMASFDVTEDALVAERKVVAQEWAAKRASPWGWVLDDYLAAGFEGTSYRRPPIGDMEQLRAARVDELRAFFARWYVPANATLIIAGDFDLARTQAAVKRFFAWIAGGVAPAHATMSSAPTTRPRVWEVRREVAAPAIVIGVPTPAFGDRDYALLRVLRTSLRDRLRHFLVGTAKPLALAVDVQLLRMEDAGSLVVVAVLAPGATFERTSEAIFAQLKVIYYEVRQHEIDVEAGLNKIEDLVRRETDEGLTREIAESLLMPAGKQGTLAGDDDELASMSRLDIDRFGRMGVKYFDPARAATLKIVPETEHRQRAAIELTARRTQDAPAVRSAPAAPAATTQPSVRFPADYPHEPPLAEAPAPRPPDRIVDEISGAKVIVLPDASASLVHWSVLLRHAHGEPAGKEGVAEVTATLLAETVHRQVFDPRPRKRELVLGGTALQVDATASSTVLRAAAEPEKLEEGLEFTRRLLREPDFHQRDFREEPLAGAKQKVAAEAMLAAREPQFMAAKELFAAVKGSPPRVATPASVMGLSLDDVRAFHRQVYGPTGATIIVAGKVSGVEGMRIAHAIVDGWTPQAGSFGAGAAPPLDFGELGRAASSRPVPADGKMRIVLVDRPGAVQCTVRMIAPAFDGSSPQRWAGAVAGQILGEGLWSRLGRFVRTERGYVYVASARFVPLHDDGYFLGSCDTDAAEIPATLSAVLGQIAAMRDGSVNDQELAEAKSALAARRIVGDEGAHQRAARELARETTLGVPTKAGDSDRALGADDDEHAADYDERVRAVSAADVQAVMRDYARPEKMTIVIVGPADALEASLQPLGVVRVVR